MTIKIGLLTFEPAVNNLDILAQPVQKLFKDWKSETPVENILSAEIDPDFAGSAEFCQKYQIQPEQGANTIIVKGKRAGEIKYSACLIPVNKKLDVNHVVKKFLNVSDVSFAPMDYADEASGMEYGSITIVGLPSDWPILIDQSLIDKDYLVVGGGLRKAKILIPGKMLTELPNAVILKNLGK